MACSTGEAQLTSLLQHRFPHSVVCAGIPRSGRPTWARGCRGQARHVRDGQDDPPSGGPYRRRNYYPGRVRGVQGRGLGDTGQGNWVFRGGEGQQKADCARPGRMMRVSRICIVVHVRIGVSDYILIHAGVSHLPGVSPSELLRLRLTPFLLLLALVHFSLLLLSESLVDVPNGLLLISAGPLG